VRVACSISGTISERLGRMAGWIRLSEADPMTGAMERPCIIRTDDKMIATIGGSSSDLYFNARRYEFRAALLNDLMASQGR
jgi:hypothetical protein